MEGIGGIASAVAVMVAVITFYASARRGRKEQSSESAAALRQQMLTVLQSARSFDKQLQSLGGVYVARALAVELRTHHPTTSFGDILVRFQSEERLRRPLITAATLAAPPYQEVVRTMREIEHADIVIRGRLRVLSASSRLLLNARSRLYSIAGMVENMGGDGGAPDLCADVSESHQQALIKDLPIEVVEAPFADRLLVLYEAAEPMSREMVQMIDALYNILVALDDDELIALTQGENPEAEAATTVTGEIDLRLTDLRPSISLENYDKLRMELLDVDRLFLRGTFPKRERSVTEDAPTLKRYQEFPPDREGRTALAVLDQIQDGAIHFFAGLAVDDMASLFPHIQYAPGQFLLPQRVESLLTSDLIEEVSPLADSSEGARLYRLTARGREVARLLTAPEPLPRYLKKKMIRCRTQVQARIPI